MTPPTENVFGKYGGTPAQNYEKYFVPVIGSPLGNELIEIASIHEGEQVLDVACGTGILARLALKRAGNSARVVGVDINPGMLNVAESLTTGKSIEWHEANAEDLPFADESFDIGLSQYGVQFFQDTSAGLHEMRRVLRQDGRLFVRTAGPTPQVFVILGDSLANHVSPELRGFVDKVFSLYDYETIHKFFHTAGFRDIEIRHEMKRLRLPSPEKFLWQYIESTPLSAALASISNAQRLAIEKEVVAKWQQFVEDTALILDLPDILTTARR
jgi:ubiquinone/menaquinone biosynthesis C-methylase UbiE